MPSAASESDACVGSPHHFLPQGIEKGMMAPLDDADGIIGFPYGEPGSFAAGLASAVYGHQEVVAAAFHIESDFPVVAYYDGTDIQAVRRNGVMAIVLE